MRRHNPEGKVSPTRLRCAIYTRKSTEEGLDQDFNTLDAQREAAEAFIQSQRREGWIALPERYDDGGFTGANTRILSQFEKRNVSFVAVTQQFNTSTSLGRLTLNIVTVWDKTIAGPLRSMSARSSPTALSRQVTMSSAICGTTSCATLPGAADERASPIHATPGCERCSALRTCRG